MPLNRCTTDSMKEEFIAKLLELWKTGNNQHMRFGQFVYNALRLAGSTPADFEDNFFFIEDLSLLESVIQYYGEE